MASSETVKLFAWPVVPDRAETRRQIATVATCRAGSRSQSRCAASGRLPTVNRGNGRACRDEYAMRYHRQQHGPDGDGQPEPAELIEAEDGRRSEEHAQMIARVSCVRCLPFLKFRCESHGTGMIAERENSPCERDAQSPIAACANNRLLALSSFAASLAK